MTDRGFELTPLSPATITVLAPAKINLVLKILDRRPDGHHNLWSLMQTVGLEDEVTIQLSQSHAGIRLQCDSRTLSSNQTNLVYRAAEAVLHRSGLKRGMDIVLTKRIPMGAGLGGGSSDAAATIIGLNQLMNLGWSIAEMSEMGQELGSDVPFFFFAPSAVVTGRGEQVTPVQITEKRWVVLVNPGFPIETKWAYQRLSLSRIDMESLPDSFTLSVVGERSLFWGQVLKTANNDFEVPVFTAYPVLKEIKQMLLAQGAEVALLSGSGATVFGVFRDEAKAQQARAHFQNNPRFKVFAVPTRSGPLIYRS